MDEKTLIEMVAGDYVRVFGRHAPAYLRERQEVAAALGDDLSAIAWGELAEAADGILSQSN